MHATGPRVVHFSSVHQVADVRIFLKECRSLAAAGYQVTLVARGDQTDVVDGVTRIGVDQSAPGGRIGRILLGTTRIVRTAWQQHGDLYHFHDPELLPFGIILKLMGKKVVYDAHENIRDQILSKPYLPTWSRKPLARAVGIVEDIAIRMFNGVVTATPRIGETLATSHTVTVGNFPVSEEISSSESDAPREAGKVVFVGGFTSIRGSREMVQAIGLVNETVPAQLVICGTMSAAVRGEVESLPGWKFVDDRGWQERHQTQAIMSSGTCGLCVFHPEPNHVEALPNKLFEYMGSGLPVVASNFPFWRQFVEDTGAGVMVDPLDPRSVADGILRVVTNPDQAREMGTSGASAVRERFNWDAEAVKLVDLYRGILGR